MANEATVQVVFSINKQGTPMVFNPQPQTWHGNVANVSAPTPGEVVAQITPTLVSFGSLVVPAYCLIQNLDTANFVEVGLCEYPITGTPSQFYPVLEIQAGEEYPYRFSRNLLTETRGLYLRANNAPVIVSVQAFSE